MFVTIAHVNNKQAKTLRALFEEPVPHLQIKWISVLSLIKTLGGVIEQGNGSRVKIKLRDRTAYVHTPHPRKEIKAYQAKAIRELLESREITP